MLEALKRPLRALAGRAALRLVVVSAIAVVFAAGGTLSATAEDGSAQPVPPPTTDTTTATGTTSPPTGTAPADPSIATEDTASVPDAGDYLVVKPRSVAGDAAVAESDSASESPLDATVVTVVATPPAARPAASAQPREHRRAQRTAASSGPSVVWLRDSLPDPTPPSQRLRRSFGRMLVHTAASRGADWALEYGYLRAEGLEGRVPAGATGVESLATLFAGLRAAGDGDRQSVLELTGDPEFADRAVALAHYARAVGIESLISGLDASRARLTRRLLTDPRVFLYPGGRDDLEAGRVDVRVVATIAYLADTFGSIDVSCLVSGHRLYARPGVISAHVYGQAVDVAALGGVPILGHQEPGGVTEQAVRSLLLLPGAMEPKQVISLLGLGGPSFPLPDHYDHIHVGF